MLPVCPTGFISFDGGIAGDGISLHVATLEKCTLDCKANHECRSFAHDKHNNVCKLFSEPLPNEEMSEDGSHFCSKRGMKYCTNLMNIYSFMSMLIFVTIYFVTNHILQSVRTFPATAKIG